MIFSSRTRCRILLVIVYGHYASPAAMLDHADRPHLSKLFARLY